MNITVENTGIVLKWIELEFLMENIEFISWIFITYVRVHIHIFLEFQFITV